MTHLQVLLVATVTWTLWLPAAALDSSVRGKRGSISVFPVLPLFPLAAWGLAYVLNLVGLPVGVAIIGGCHLLLAAAMLASIVRAKLALHRKASTTSDTSRMS